MKHIKLFESFEDIDSICKKYNIKNYTINPDGSVDVDGDVSLSNYRFVKLPLKFGRVSGYFDCSLNKLSTLEGSPREVDGDFLCYNNQLTTLEGAPREVGGNFYCQANRLTTLEGSPERVRGDFFCRSNQLTTLKGTPSYIGSYFDFRFNPVHNIYILFKDKKNFMESLDWDYIRGNKIVKSRFIDACEEAEIEVPESIKGYEYI
jgi:hypothetical protein